MANNKIRGITIELNADTAGILDGLKDIQKSLAPTETALKDINKLLKFDPENVTLLAQKQDYLTKAIEGTEEKLKRQKELLESLQTADNSSQTVEQQKALEREIEATTTKLNSYKGELDQTNQSLNELGNRSSTSAENVGKTSDAIMALAQSKAFSMIADNAKEVYEALLQCDEAADKFEFAMAKVDTLANAGAGLSKWGEEIKQYATALGVSSADFAEGVYQAMSASVAAEDAVEFTANMTKLAIGGFTDTATAVDVVTTALNAYGLEAEATSHIMDDLIATQNLGKTTVSELGAAMGKVIPTAAAYGVDIDNLAAAYSELTAKGVKTKIATTQMNTMFQELGNSEKTVNQILKEMTGDTFGKFMEKGNSLGDVMKILWEYSEEDKEAFMGLWDSSTAASAAFNLAADGGKRFSELLAEMSNNSGLAEQNFQKIAETGEMLDARMEVAMENLRIAIGDALGPALDSITEKGLAFLEPFTKFIEENPEIVAALTGMVGGVVGVTTALTACTAAIALFKLALGDISSLASILGSAAILGGIAGLGLAMDETASKARTLKSAMEEATSKSSADYSKNIASVEALGARIRELNSIEELSIGQKYELASAVAQWNEVMGESDQLIIDNTGHIEGNTEALAQNLEVAEKQYRLAQKQEELNDILERRAELEDVIAEAEARAIEIDEALTEGTVRSAEARRHMNNELISLDETITESQQAIAEYGNRYDELVNEINGATESTDEFTNSTGEVVGTTGEIDEALEELIKKYGEVKESLITSLNGQREAFTQFGEETSKSVSELKDDFQKQAEGMQHYAELVAEAYKIMKADPEANDLLQYYISQGPAAEGELNNLVEAFNGTAEQVKEFNEAVAAFNETNDLLEQIATLSAGIETGYTEPIDNALVAIEENVPIITQTLQDSYTEQQENAEANRTTMTETATGTVTDMADAINTNAPLVSTAAKNMMDSAVKETKTAIGMSEDSGRSTVFYDLGRNIDQSIADGVTDNASVISSALQSALDSAVSGLSMTGLTSVINRALGEALG